MEERVFYSLSSVKHSYEKCEMNMNNIILSADNIGISVTALVSEFSAVHIYLHSERCTSLGDIKESFRFQDLWKIQVIGIIC